jgi:hypothetical protein
MAGARGARGSRRSCDGRSQSGRGHADAPSVGGGRGRLWAGGPVARGSAARVTFILGSSDRRRGGRAGRRFIVRNRMRELGGADSAAPPRAEHRVQALHARDGAAATQRLLQHQSPCSLRQAPRRPMHAALAVRSFDGAAGLNARHSSGVSRPRGSGAGRHWPLTLVTQATVSTELPVTLTLSCTESHQWRL